MEYMDDQQYADLTGNWTPEDPNYAWDPGYSELYGESSYTPPDAGGYENQYFDLASQLADAGIIPQDQWGAPDLSSLLSPQYSEALDSGQLGDLSQYSSPQGFDAAQQMALDQANLVGGGYEVVVGNPDVVVDPATGELIDKVDLYDRMNIQRPAMSRPNTRLNDILARDQYPMSTVDEQGDVIAQQGPYSAIYNPEDPKSFDWASGLVDYQARPGGGLYDDISLGDKVMRGLGGALSAFRGTPSQAGGNASNASTRGQQQAMSLAQMLAQAAGIFQKGKGASAAPGDARRIGSQGWQVSRKAGSGRKNKASGGALGLLHGGSTGQDDIVPINAAHGEYVMDADTVSALGDGNTEAGAKKLDEMRMNIRKHKRSAPPDKIPPKAKGALQYMKGGK